MDTSKNDMVSLATMISERYGVSPALAQDQIDRGMTTIDGESIGHSSRMKYFRRGDVEGKEISVKGPMHSFTFTYETLADFPHLPQ